MIFQYETEFGTYGIRPIVGEGKYDLFFNGRFFGTYPEFTKAEKAIEKNLTFRRKIQQMRKETK